MVEKVIENMKITPFQAQPFHFLAGKTVSYLDHGQKIKLHVEANFDDEVQSVRIIKENDSIILPFEVLKNIVDELHPLVEGLQQMQFLSRNEGKRS